jgi:hypothetical protein
LLFICNISRYESVEFSMRAEPPEGCFTEYDCETGAVRDIYYEGGELRVKLPACGSVCYMANPADGGARTRPTADSMRARPAASSTWTNPAASKVSPDDVIINKYTNFHVSREKDNMLAINSCSVKVGGGTGTPATEMSGTATSLNVKLREFFEGAGYYAGDSRQPWTYTADEKAVSYPLSAKYTFYARGEIARLKIAAEYPDAFDVFLNGVKLEPDGYFIDRDIVAYEALRALRQGKNIIELNGRYNIETTLESVYVVGGFTVENHIGASGDAGGSDADKDGTGGKSEVSGADAVYTLAADAMPSTGDAAKQGHPFYCGALSYETEVNVPKTASGRIIARLDGFCGAVSKIFMNGAPVAVRGWEPYEADITDYIADGNNTLRVDVYSSGQNIFGPHANIRVPGLVTPGSFYAPDEGVFSPFGLREGVTILERYKY